MDIRQIVEDTLVAPAREQAAQLQFEDNIKRIKYELDARQGLIEAYREKNYAHERMVGKLLDLLDNDDLDGARDLVKAEYDAIHGPAD